MDVIGARHSGAVSNRISGVIQKLLAGAMAAKTQPEKHKYYFAISILTKDLK